MPEMRYHAGVEMAGIVTERRQVVVTAFEVTRKTPCGVWIKLKGGPYLATFCKEKFILERHSTGRDVMRRWAWPSPDAAIVSTHAKTKKRLHLLNMEIERAEADLEALEDEINSRGIVDMFEADYEEEAAETEARG